MPGGFRALTPQRQMDLIWRYLPPLARQRSIASLDELVRDAQAEPCETMSEPESATVLTARFGDDGRYHLLSGGVLQCGPRRVRPTRTGQYLHDDYMFWWTDGPVYRIQAPQDAWHPETHQIVRGTEGAQSVSWRVTIGDIETDPALVPVRQRCPISHGWPGYQGLDRAAGKQRARLVAEFGGQCCVCRRDRGTHIDHDHFTGMVRGLLCGYCNSFAHECLHVSGCPMADYLNDPPAARLRMLYYKATKATRLADADARTGYLGFNPFYRPENAPGPVGPPAPSTAVGIDLSAVSAAALF